MSTHPKLRSPGARVPESPIPLSGTHPTADDGKRGQLAEGSAPQDTTLQCHGCGAGIPRRVKGGVQRKWCSERCRKAQYAGVCVDCGAPTSGSNGRGPAAPQRCASCQFAYQHDGAHWTPERIVAAIQRWASEHDGVAPIAWLYERPEYGPAASTVLRVMGSWNEGLRAAGFDVHREPRVYSAVERATALRLYAAGLSPTLIEERTGVFAATVGLWADQAGIRRSPSAAATALWARRRAEVAAA